MKRWIVRAHATSLDDLVLEEVEIPQPGAGEVRVNMQAMSLNYRDVVVLRGTKGMGLSRDIIPLSDGAGIIDAVGPGVTGWSVGDRVVTHIYQNWMDGPLTSDITLGLGSQDLDGTLAEYAILPAQNILAAPTSLTVVESATLPCAGLTAWCGLQGNSPYLTPLKSGEKVLILGTGGVAMQAVAIALALGAEVYCTTSQQSKAEILRAMGVKEVVNYRTNPHWGKEVATLSGGGVDLVVNTAGIRSMGQGIVALKLAGRMSLIGALEPDDHVDNMMLVIMKNLTLFGVLAGSYQAHKDYIAFIDAHQVKPLIQTVYGFDQAREAYAQAASGSLFGKIVIQV